MNDQFQLFLREKLNRPPLGVPLLFYFLKTLENSLHIHHILHKRQDMIDDLNLNIIVVNCQLSIVNSQDCPSLAFYTAHHERLTMPSVRPKECPALGFKIYDFKFMIYDFRLNCQSFIVHCQFITRLLLGRTMGTIINLKSQITNQ